MLRLEGEVFLFGTAMAKTLPGPEFFGFFETRKQL
jgi:hypothetical protein